MGDRFELYGALWRFAADYHGGQSSRGYRLLSRLSRTGYRPGIGLQQGRFESRYQRDIYQLLVSRYGKDV